MNPLILRANALCAAFLIVGLVVPVRATVITGSFTGVVTNSSNAEAVFGSATSLIGQTINGTFTYDTELLPSLNPASTPTLGAWLNAYSITPPFLSMTQTINGQSITFGSTYYEELDLAHGDPPFDNLPFLYQMFSLVSQDRTPLSGSSVIATGQLLIGASDDSVAIVGNPHDPSAAFSLSAAPFGQGSGELDDVDPNTGNVTVSRVWNFNVTSASASPVSEEGATVALLGLSLAGMVGLRRRFTHG